MVFDRLGRFGSCGSGGSGGSRGRALRVVRFMHEVQIGSVASGPVRFAAFLLFRKCVKIITQNLSCSRVLTISLLARNKSPSHEGRTSFSEHS